MMKDLLVIAIVTMLLLNINAVSSTSNFNVEKTAEDNVSESELESINSFSNYNLGILDSFGLKEGDSIKKDSEEPDYVPGEFIVKFKNNIHYETSSTVDNSPSVGIASIDVLNERFRVLSIDSVFLEGRVRNAKSSTFSNVYKFHVSKKSDILSIVEEYNSDPNVEYAEPNYLYQICTIPNDPLFEEQWALNQIKDFDIDAPEAWDIETGSSDVVVAIVDTGVDYNHPDIIDNIWVNEDEIPGNDIDDDENGYIDDVKGWDFYNNDSNPMDDFGHGTHCAGIIGAQGNNSVGIAGVCWNVSIMPLKAFSSGGYGYTDDLANAINYAVDNDADVISMSFGGEEKSKLLKDAIDYAYSKGVILVASAGNSNKNVKSYPAAYKNVISVAAIDDNGRKAFFSNYGEWIDVAAPGLNILSLKANGTDMYGDEKHIVDNDYYICSGTSMACPYVSGLAALILSKNHSLSGDTIKQIIIKSSTRLHPTAKVGYGIINAYEALRMACDFITSVITNPIDGYQTSISENIEIRGDAYGQGFKYYILEYAKNINPKSSDWIEIKNSTSQIHNNTLGYLDSTLLSDGLYLIQLKVICNDGYHKDQVFILINKEENTFIVDDDVLPDVDFHSIQEGAYNCGDGDTVLVKEGTYNEVVEIHKQIKLTGENRKKVKIESFRDQFSIKVFVDGVNISGFTIKNDFLKYFGLYKRYPCCIKLKKINDTKIWNNIIHSEYPYSNEKKNAKKITIKNNIPTDLVCGIIALENRNFLIKNNDINTASSIGILIRSINKSNGIISKNNISNCYTAINVIAKDFPYGPAIEIFENNIFNNINGIYMYYSNNSQIYHNNFISNELHAFDNGGENRWYNSTLKQGNFWYDYDGIDANMDGIGDTPYNIPGGNNKDLYPLVYNSTDMIPPSIKITKPEKGLYLFNNLIIKYSGFKPLIIGRIEIEVDVIGNKSRINHVEFYIDNELKHNDTEYPYSYEWKKDKILGSRQHTHMIKVVAYYNYGDSNYDEIIVKRYL